MAGRATAQALTLVLALTVLALGGAPFGTALAQKGGAKKSAKGKARPKPVVVAEIRAVTETPTFKANGLLAPVEKALLSVEVSGKVSAIRVREGDDVAQNQILAQLTNSNLELERTVLKARLRESEAQLALSRQKLRRTEALFRKNLASAEEYENEVATTRVTEAAQQSALAQLRRIETQLEMMVVRAPISGQVIKSNLEIGQWIDSNKPIYEIYNFGRFKLDLGVPGRFLNQIDKEVPVSVRVSEIGTTLKGVIRAVVRHVDSASGNFMLRVEVANPKQIPISGLLAHIDVPVGRRGTVLTVPRDAIVRRAGKTQVVVVRKGRAAIVPVKVQGNINQSDVIVGGGLKAKEKVVVRGNERLFPGMPVRVTGTL